MASIAELQKALDNNAIDVSTLNRDQLLALDNGFKNGTLKGYSDIRELMKEQGGTASLLAKEKEGQLAPFATATEGLYPFGTKNRQASTQGIERIDFELAGDVTGSLMPYMLDANKIARATIASGGKANFALARVAEQAHKMGKLAQAVTFRTPAGKAVGMLGRTAAVWNRFARGADKLMAQGKYGLGKKFKKPGIFGEGTRVHVAPSQLLATELKSQAGGIAGAGLGSITYGVAEALTDIGGATHEDLARVSENDIDKLSPLHQEIVHASEAMSNAMIFNAGAFLLVPLLGGIGRGVQGIMGLKGEPAEIIANEAYKYGYKTNLSATMNEHQNWFAGFVKNYNKSVGIFPVVGAARKKFRRQFEIDVYNNFLDNFNAAVPLAHGELLSLGALTQFRKQFDEMFNIIGVKYQKGLDATKFNGLDGLRIIPTNSVGSFTDDLIKRLEMQYPEQMRGLGQMVNTKSPITELDDPLVAFIKHLKSLSDSGNITPQEFIGLQKMLTKVLPNTTIYDPRGMVKALRESMEKDWATVGGAEGIENLMKTKGFKDAFDAQVTQGGKAAGDAYTSKIQKGLKEVMDAQLEANSFFHNTVMPYYSPVARKISRSVDSQIFTNLGMLGITGRAQRFPDELWTKTIRDIFKSSSAPAIEDLKKLMGYGTSKTGTQMFNQFRDLFMFDAFRFAYTKQPGSLGKRGLYELLDEAKSSGVLNRRYIDEINNEFTADTLLKGVDPTKLIESGLGTRPWKALKVGANEVGTFKPELFAENLGLAGKDSDAFASKIVQMYGGGKQGKESLRHLKALIDVLEGEYGVKLADSSTFIQRRIALGMGGGKMGFASALGGGLMAGGTAGGVVGGGIFPGLITSVAMVLGLRKFGGYLGDPQALKRTYDLFTELERIENKMGGDGVHRMLWNTSEEGGRKARRLFAQWWNWMADEEKDAPRVNPNKIDFEEIMNYLNDAPDRVPDPVWKKDALIPSMRNRSYAMENALSKSSTASLAAGDNYLRGVRTGLEKNLQATTIDYDILSGKMPPPAEGQPNQAQVGASNPMGGSFNMANAPQNTQARANQYQALWPQDALGQGIAQKNV